MSPRTKISGPRSLLPYLANFRPRALSRYAVTLETAVTPLPPAVLDPDPRARHRLIPSPGAPCRLDPGLGAWHRRPLPQASGHCHTATIDHDSTTLGACRCHQP
jgi:hypothetical protein